MKPDYTYDANGKITGLEGPYGDVVPLGDAKFAYDATGNVAGLQGPNGPFRLKKSPQTPGGIVFDWVNNAAPTMVSADAGNAVAVDSSVLIDGQPSLKCTFSNAASGTYLAEVVLNNPVSLAKVKTIQVPVKITSNEAASGVGLSTAAFQVWVYLASGKTIRLQMNFDGVPPGKVHVFSFSRYSTTGGMVVYGSGATGFADFDGTDYVTKIRIVQATIAASAAYPVWVGPIRTDARSVGRVSIVMDGEYDSQYSLIKPLLDKYGFKTSLAITNADIGAAGRMTLAQINEMYQAGHECIHHTFDSTKTAGYVNAASWPNTAVIANDVRQQWDYFRAQGWFRGIGKAVVGFAEAFTSTTANARQNLVMDALRSAGVECWRKSTNLYTTQMSLGNKATAPFMLRGAVQVTSTDTPASIQAIIDQAEDTGEWAIITLHRAVADSATPGSLEMRVSDMATWLAYLQSRVAAGKLIVAPLGETYDECFK
jgi:hypothetical protein